MACCCVAVGLVEDAMSINDDERLEAEGGER